MTVTINKMSAGHGCAYLLRTIAAAIDLCRPR
jgi:hypothetical protein